MKYVALFFVLCLFWRFADAQKTWGGQIKVNLKGKVKKMIEYSLDQDSLSAKQDSTKIVINFDEKGNQSDVTYDQNGISTKTFLTYSKNKIVGREYYNGKLASIAIHLFDVNGNEVETDLNYIQDSSGRQNGKTLYKYDKKGHKVGEDLYIDKKLVENTTNVYDKDNQLIEENETMYLPHEVKKQRTTNAYDQLGNNIKSEVYAPNGELIEEDVYTYSNYDQNGNWRSAIYIFKSFRYDKAGTSSKSIVKREITYFK